MKYKINQTFNTLSVLMDEKQHLARLADFIDKSDKFRVMEIRYNTMSSVGTIIIYCNGANDEAARATLQELVAGYIYTNQLN